MVLPAIATWWLHLQTNHIGHQRWRREVGGQGNNACKGPSWFKHGLDSSELARQRTGYFKVEWKIGESIWGKPVYCRKGSVGSLRWFPSADKQCHSAARKNHTLYWDLETATYTMFKPVLLPPQVWQGFITVPCLFLDGEQLDRAETCWEESLLWLFSEHCVVWKNQTKWDCLA